MHGHRERQFGDERDRHERRIGVVGQLLVQRRVDGLGADIAHQQGVAVGARAGDGIGADLPGRAALVLDHHRLAPARGQALGDDARAGIGAAAGRERHDQRDRARRVRGLRERATGEAEGERRRDATDEHAMKK